ncbi:D-beta-hydroxybutyrate dehydrogenase, mitochondrial-like [Bacillus rossius redtenbacheri]|uniref:D-beta-hydroxybutyrate dehydrogenase, mitochondrial-like n=1 Tax=Bacillus rossius redtenbacheri TaxID=93214 RepID=UPI002FDE2351
MENSLDSLYRAALWGLQVGTVTGAAGLLAQLLGLPLPDYVTPPSACFAGLALGATVLFLMDSLQISTKDRAVVVTGCDSGFGHEMVFRLERMGLVVFAGCLFANGEGAQKLKDSGRKNIHVMQLNVTSDDEVKDAVEYVRRHLPPNGLWGILNNAGWSTFGHVEWVPIDICKRIMDINVWGTIRVTQGFLPLLRQSKGRVVNVASGLGRQCAANRSTYGITKYGVEALSDCLRFEMRKWGVEVVIIEPGNFVNATGIFTPDSIRRDAEALWKRIPSDVQKDYTKEYFDAVIENMIYYSTKGTTDKSSVLDAMTLALLHRYPHPRYQPMEVYFKVRTWVNTHLPEWVYEKLYT